ncbi:hypothetical protein DI272_41410 [Streptomyces sp. Act143]|uniref:hypothetical protein n=1 Tax=Streptomyces sp. Act143 TaxID=2200760 RepID=UPI000D67C536|nr:hypothetical protein [Streptomyces sp. Act143]PWI19911.1 hypothetical protein DI272_41410 [Streptomyces sp. Act143]
MHRTTTTATLLVTVAVSALSGCVTVQRPPVPGPPAAPSLPATAPRPDGQAEPQIVQAPAREALELIGPSPDAKPGTADPGRAAPPSAAPEPAPRQQAPRTHPEHPAHPAHPEAGRPQHPGRPHVEIPDVATAVPKNPDVCGLGRQYGGWHKDSPEARICEQTYGH